MVAAFGSILGLDELEYERLESISYDTVLGRWEQSGDLMWAKTFGAGRGYVARDLAVMEGGVIVVVGGGNGDIGGTHLGATDVFVSAYGADGNWLWSDRFGTGSFDAATAVVASGMLVYVTGNIAGALATSGDYFEGGSSWFVAAYEVSGELHWLREYRLPACQSLTRSTECLGSKGTSERFDVELLFNAEGEASLPSIVRRFDIRLLEFR